MITAQDQSVQIKLIIMFAVAVIVIATILGSLIYKRHRWLNKFTIPLWIIEVIVISILVDVITLP